MSDKRDLYFVIGGGGLLGRAIVSAAQSKKNYVYVPKNVPWDDSEEAVRKLIYELNKFFQSTSCLYPQKNFVDIEWNILWCAGAGTTNTTKEKLEAEYLTFKLFVDFLLKSDLLVISNLNFFYASSAGGVYAGSSNPPFTEHTIPNPISPYGHIKLRCEKELEKLNKAGATIAVGRIANLYGPGQDLSKAQGLISQISLAHYKGTFNKIFVPLDTIRDYIYIDDVAHLVLAFIQKARANRPQKYTIKIIASGNSYTVADIIGLAKGIFKCNIPYLHAITSQTFFQARDLRLKSIVFSDLNSLVHTALPAGFAKTSNDIALQYQKSMAIFRA